MNHAVRFEVASRETLQAAVRLQQTIYNRDRGHTPHEKIDAHAQHFVAIVADTVVGYFRLLGPEARPFDFEDSVDVDRLLGVGARPALVGRLCIDPSYRSVRRSVLVNGGLLRLAIDYARKHDITDLVLYTYDDLRAFYRSARFEDTHIIFQHKYWGRVRLMRRSLASDREMPTS